MTHRNLLVLLLAFVVSYACYVRAEQNPYSRYLAEGLAAIDELSLEHVPDRELFDGAMRGMVDVLDRRGDPHSRYLNREEAEPLRTEIRQRFGGIGVKIGFDGEPPQLTILEPPIPGSPAALKKLRNGDRIRAIDGKPTDGMQMLEVLSLMRGMPGEKVSLAIQSDGDRDPRDVELVREEIQLESVLGDRRAQDGGWIFRLEADPRIAHVRISSFGERTPEELRNVLTSVIESGAEAVVLDLRDNPGGSLDASVAVCNHFLPAGKLVVQTRGRDRKPLNVYKTTIDGDFQHLPLVVMVNENSASAAEIVAACLQDHGRALVAGQRSHGKGTVQQIIPVESGESILKLTWASFWRPSDAKIHRAVGEPDSGTWGVVPDASLEHVLSEKERDAFLEFRAKRDTLLLAKDDRDPSAESVEDGFADAQLQIAINHLQKELGSKAE